MFGRKKRGSDKGEANRLRDEATPNTLTWDESNATDVADKDFELDDDLEVNDPEAAARRTAELKAELQRQAEEFGLSTYDPKAQYGPNGEDVEAVLDALGSISINKAERLADAWTAVDTAERDVVERELRRDYRSGKHEYELSAAEDAVSAWLTEQTDSADGLWQEVGHAARDAMVAIILDEDLSDDDYDTLYGPWASVMDVEDGDEAAEDAKETGPEAAADEADGTDEAGEFGPNTALVVEFLSQLDSLEAVQTAELVTRWRDQPKDELRIAHRSVQDLADEDGTWREQLRLAQEEVFAWMDHRPTSHLDSAMTVDRTHLRQSAGPVAADAIAALVLADILEPDDAEILYAPWAEIVGAPELPQFEED